ncbi:MAG TPA: ATP-binding protein [Opitutaceae bacterium]|nr:ATP-binding protein [Opitutaceae bacterium]
MRSHPTPTGHREPVVSAVSGRTTVSATVEDLCQLIDPSRELVVAVTPLGHIRHVTDNVRSLLGFAPDELVGGSVFTQVHPDDLRRAQRWFALRVGRGQFRHRHKNGEWRWFYVTGTDVTAPAGGTERVLIARDIAVAVAARDECERLKAEIGRMEHFASLGLLAGGVAHDFNNLLTAVTAYASQALEEVNQPGVADALDHILKAAQRAADLAHGVVACVRRDSQERRAGQLAPVVGEALALLRPLIAKNVILETRLDAGAGVVVANGCQVHRVVLNLCHNALHAMKPAGGRLTVELTRVAAANAPAKLRAWRADAAVCLAVTDTGCGMGEEEQRRIFEPLFTTKSPHEGSGLGLAVVDRVVREHGGAVSVSSHPGQGSCFRVWFPLVTPPAAD